MKEAKLSSALMERYGIKKKDAIGKVLWHSLNENAQIGVTDDKLVYDYDKCVEIFMEREGWEEEEAIEWMEYNVVCQNKALTVRAAFSAFFFVYCFDTCTSLSTRCSSYPM